MLTKPESLKLFVLKLQDEFSSMLTKQTLDEAIYKLKNIDPGWEYEDGVYPELIITDHFDKSNIEQPSNLAEAFIWKQRDWASYRKFVEYVRDTDKKPKDRLSHYAFAMHVGKLRKPITDQHALRALWALTKDLDPEIHTKLRRFLTYSNKGAKQGLWKEYGQSTTVLDCYNWYIDKFEKLDRADDVTDSHIDMLLMPLGKALKSVTADDGYASFHEICAWTTS